MKMQIKRNMPFIKLCLKIAQTLNKQNASDIRNFMTGNSKSKQETKRRRR